jgi:glutamate-1-semialdehyde 2,1-aminomutase
LARGATGREKILKFSGCYHGHADSMLVQAGSGAGRQQHHGRRCFADSAASQTTVAAYNDCEETERLIRLSGDSLAAIIVEPVAANMGLILPAPDFLHRLRELADDSGALLIFDEVITGFRTHFGCRQQLCGVTPDLTCLGKIIGGGLPIGAVGGPASIMELLAPLGPVNQAGTFRGNPISAAAGLATLRLLAEHQPYGKMAERTNLMAHMLEKQAKALGLPLNIPRLGGMFSLSFGNRAPRSLDDALKSNGELFARFFNLLLDEGIYIPPSPLETCFVSSAHDSATIERAMDSFAVALGNLAAIRKDFSTCQGMTVS